MGRVGQLRVGGNRKRRAIVLRPKDWSVFLEGVPAARVLSEAAGCLRPILESVAWVVWRFTHVGVSQEILDLVMEPCIERFGLRPEPSHAG